MRTLIAITALAGLLAAAAHAQSDTARPIKIRGASSGSKLRSLDSIAAGDIESIEVVKRLAARALYGGQMLPEERSKAVVLFESQRAIWNERRPRKYVIRVHRDGCIHVTTRRLPESGELRDQLVVRDTFVIGRQQAPIHPRYARTCGNERHVEDLFSHLGAALADSTAGVFAVQYDGVYGFPRSCTVFRGDNHGVRVIVESFAPVR